MSSRKCECCCDCDCGCNCNCGCDFDECCCETKCCKCPELKPNRSMLKCGMPGAVTIPLATLAGTTFTLATVNVDTKKICNPCIKFDFSSNIVTTAAVLTLNFQVFKQCGNQLVPIPVGPIWTFSRLVAVTDSNTFSFVVCDCDTCGGDCCTYSVVATIAGVATVGVTSINNAALSATIVENGCGC